MNPLEARLAALAAAGQTMTYGALARDLGLRIGELTAALERLMVEDAEGGLPFRAAVMAARTSVNHMPAKGFFDLAAALGADVSDPEALVREHRARLELVRQRTETL